MLFYAHTHTHTHTNTQIIQRPGKLYKTAEMVLTVST